MKRGVCVLSALFKDIRPATMTAEKSSDLYHNFKEWKFKSPPNYAELPINDNPEYNVPMAVNNAIFSKVPTEPIPGNISLVCKSDDTLTQILDLDQTVAESQEFIDFAAGKYLPDGGLSVSHRYGGYQFGYWADQLGDGRAHILGEYVNKKGDSWQPQLKGSGETPYSRFGDGRAVLRSSIREMVASEACHALGVPTTRAAALVASDSPSVWRDKTYSGRMRQELAAVVVRLSPAWYRIGSLEILLKRNEHDLLRTFTDFVIMHHFPDIDVSSEDRYLDWFKEVAHRNLDMVATWQGVGFTHGVLNTDNISLLGLTIDYGPFGFIDHYYEFFVPNTSDDMGRYAFDKQPAIILWNLGKLAEALVPILTEDQKQKIEEIKGSLKEYVMKKVLQTYLSKLGLKTIHEGDGQIVHDLLQLMQDVTADFTMTFRQLGEVEISKLTDLSVVQEKWALKKLVEKEEDWGKWVEAYQDRCQKENVNEEDRRERMSSVNPVYVPRNWMLEEAIKDAENKDNEKVQFLMKILRNPYEYNEEADKRGYSSLPPSWAYGLKLSCSS